jgi:hypothetical protein
MATFATSSITWLAGNISTSGMSIFRRFGVAYRLSRVLFGDSLLRSVCFQPWQAREQLHSLARSRASWADVVGLSCSAAWLRFARSCFWRMVNFFSMNAFEPLFWMGCIYLLVRIINGGSPRLWLLFGLLAGSA